jgi:gamma-glutamyltranspeptidase/glutathione hydrolase
MQFMKRLLATTFTLGTLVLGAGASTSCAHDSPTSAPATKHVEPAVVETGAVAVPDEFAANAAEQILTSGGNAVDAAVAVEFALAVTYPEAGNIGGGGMMTLYVDGQPYFLDYRERAPAAATRDMYLDDKGNANGKTSVVGHRAIAVPGTVMGLWEAHRRFGKLPWKQVMAPALRLARDGFVVPAMLVERRDFMKKSFEGKVNFLDYFGQMKPGELFRQPELEATLLRIAEDGAKGFYEGKVAALVTAEMSRRDGLITAADLATYTAVWRKPIRTTWNGLEVVTAPPPSSGGIGLIQLLKMKVAMVDAFKGVPLNSAQYVHLLAELEKRVFADRAEYLGDPDFNEIPVDRLLDDRYIARRVKTVSLSAPSPTEEIAPGLGESDETTHISIVDRWGNAVSSTYTLNGKFGSGVVVTGAGFLMNNEMDDFSIKPGVANRYGVVGTNANAIAPGKRMLSSMTPTILLKDGTVAMVIGTPGGSRIFTSVFQVMCNVYEFHLPLEQAVSELRAHHQLLPANTIFSEPYKPIDGQLADDLRARGYKIEPLTSMGDIQVIQVVDHASAAASDPRGRGRSRLIH